MKFTINSNSRVEGWDIQWDTDCVCSLEEEQCVSNPPLVLGGFICEMCHIKPISLKCIQVYYTATTGVVSLLQYSPVLSYVRVTHSSANKPNYKYHTRCGSLSKLLMMNVGQFHSRCMRKVGDGMV